MISAPKEPDFFKSTVLGVDDIVQGLGGGCGELCHPFHGGQRHLTAGECPNYSGGGCPNPTIVLDTNQDDDDLKPSNCFGRGQSVSSVSTGRCGGIGWKPKPICRLLGGAFGNARKKMGPKAKAKESQNGNYLFHEFKIFI